MNDQAICDIGKIKIEESGYSSLYEQYVQNMFQGDEYLMIICAFQVTKVDENYNCKFLHAEIEKASENNYKKYAYRKGAANGGDITFTTKLSNPEKTYNTIMTKQIVKLLKSLTGEEKNIFEALRIELESNVEVINEIAEKFKQLDKKTAMRTGISFLFKIDDTDYYLGDFDFIKNIIIKEGTEGKSNKYDKISEGSNEICSICFQKKEKLHGFASPFKYYTLDKRGFASNFFKQEASWKNYPICSECAASFEEGYKCLNTSLKRTFYGKFYYLIPQVMIKDKRLLQKVLKLINSYNYNEKDNKQKLFEDSIFKKISEEDNFFNLTFLFYEENLTTKAINIKLIVEEVVPSRLRTLFRDIPEKINKNLVYQNSLKVKNELLNLEFNFGILKTFFEDDFYQIIYDVFKGFPVKKSLLYNKFMNTFREKYNQSFNSNNYVESTYLIIHKAHMALNYLTHLNITDYNYEYKYEVQMEQEQKEKKGVFDIEKLNEFIKTNPQFIDADYKAGIFAVGILVKLIMNIQNQNLGNTPFEKKLQGFNINSEKLKNIYKEAIDKLNQYQSIYAYNDLRNLIAEKYIVNQKVIEKISSNELSFYFVAGIEFAGKFRANKNGEN